MRHVLFLLAILGFAFGCSHGAEDKELARRWKGKSVYSLVNMRSEARGGLQHLYSTNHIGLPNLIPLGTKMTVTSINSAVAELTQQRAKVKLTIEFVAKHNLVSFDAWLGKHFGKKPPKLGKLSKGEKKAIKEGIYEIGMGRRALFLAIGYPPASLTPSESAATLIYERKRFDRVQFDLDAKGVVTKVTN